MAREQIEARDEELDVARAHLEAQKRLLDSPGGPVVSLQEQLAAARTLIGELHTELDAVRAQLAAAALARESAAARVQRMHPRHRSQRCCACSCAQARTPTSCIRWAATPPSAARRTTTSRWIPTSISRHHAVLLSSPDHCIVEDLNSTNGVLVNGRRVSRQILHDGDTVTVGKTRVQIPAAFMSEPYVERILKARVYDVAIESPLDPMPRLSARLGCEVLLKREDLQPVFSFKLRGAYNKIANLSETAAQRGVICASAGNHAQGVALAAQRRGIPAVIVMPVTTPADQGAGGGGAGRRSGAARRRVSTRPTSMRMKLAAERQLVFVHPFDDPDVIAGQGTIGMEILRQARDDIDAIFVAVGGGGLIGGIAAYVKSLFPRIRIIGVEPEDAAAMHESLRQGKRVTLDHVGMFADGVAVKRVGEETLRWRASTSTKSCW